MSKRQITLMCEVDEEVAEALEKAGLLDDPERLAATLKNSLERDKQAPDFFITFWNEFRNFLSPIIGYTGLLYSGRVGELSDQQKQFVNIARRSSLRLEFLLSEVTLYFMDIYHIDAEHSKIYLSQFLKEIRERVIAWQYPEANPILLEIQGEIPPIFGSQRHLQTIFTHIFDDAYNYSEDHQVSFKANADTKNAYLRLIIQPMPPSSLDLEIVMSKLQRKFLDGTPFNTVIKLHKGNIIIYEDTENPTVELQITLPLD